MSTFNISSIEDLVLKMEDGTEIKLNVSEVMGDTSLSKVEIRDNSIDMSLEDIKPRTLSGFDEGRDRDIIELLVDSTLLATDEVKFYLTEAILNNSTIATKCDELRGIGKSTLMCELSKTFQIPIVFSYKIQEQLYQSLGAYTIRIDSLVEDGGSILNPKFVLVDDLNVGNIFKLKAKGITPIGVTFIPQFI